jgi:hypothetical protein
MKPIASIIAFAGLSVASVHSAEAQYYRPGVTIHFGSSYSGGYRPYRVYRPYRPYRRYRPAYVVAGPYAPVCARWVWRYNRFGERRRACVAW